MFSLWNRWTRQTNQTGLSRPTESVAQYNTYDARSALSQLLKRVCAGERIVIARAGEPVAMLVPYDVPVETRPGVFRMSLLVHDAPRDAEEVTPTRSSRGAST